MTESPKNEIAEQILDQNIIVVGEGTAMATSTVYQASAHANALALHNSVVCQNHLNVLYSAIVSTTTVLINNA